MFAYYQALIRMRREHSAILDGRLEFLLDDHPHVVMYLRTCPEQTLLVVLNLSDEGADTRWPERVAGRSWRRILTNRRDTVPSLERERWLAWEAEVYALDK